MNKEAGHFDEGKPELQYILAMEGLEFVAAVGTFGTQKYGRWNYKAGMPWMKLAGSMTRHLRSWIMGEDLDRESGKPHLAHLIYDALMVLDYSKRKKHLDDRYVDEYLEKPFTKEELNILDHYGETCGPHCTTCL